MDETEFMLQTFSPAEGAEILGIPANTLRTWLRRAPGLFTQQSVGEWRRLTPDTLLAMRVMQVLMDSNSITIEIAANMVTADATRASFLDKKNIALIVEIPPNKTITQAFLATSKGLNEYVKKLGTVGYGRPPENVQEQYALIVQLLPIKNLLRLRIQECRKEG